MPFSGTGNLSCFIGNDAAFDTLVLHRDEFKKRTPVVTKLKGSLVRPLFECNEMHINSVYL